ALPISYRVTDVRHWQQWFVLTLLGQFRNLHPLQNDRDLAIHAFRVWMALVIPWVGRHRGEPSGLLRGQRRSADTEVVPSSRFAPEDAIAPFDHVEVELEDASLVEHRFEHDRDDRFLAFAPIAAVAREKQVLG